MNVFTPGLSLETMPRRTPPDDLSPEERRRWNEAHKNRNRHSVKFPDDLEADYQAWRIWHHLNDNAALKRLIETHPELKKKP